MQPEAMEKWAKLSADRQYRYVLGRRWAPGPALAVIGHNPSTADEAEDDATIRRCVGFAKRDDFGALLMLNLCAWRSTDPEALTLVSDAVGPDNDFWLRRVVTGDDFGNGTSGTVGRVVAAWGALHAKAKAQVVREAPRRVLRVLTQVVEVHAFKLTKDAHPQHPLYLPGDVVPVLYRARQVGP